jgi:hypothetical protein
MAEWIGIVIVVAVFVLVLSVFARPLLHALRTGPVPRLDLRPFGHGEDGDAVDGVREPRRPSPLAGGDAVALDVPDSD